ncbi:MAG: hypothetical protein II704_05560 [Erysipelotrichaceae bacterium]|nr:hypothetical protein [Erysipelotrichaceae bacterium]
MKQKLSELTPEGFGIYRDKKGRTIIGSPRQKKAWIVDRDSERIFMLLQNRHIIALLIFSLLGFNFTKWTAAVIVSAIVLAASEIYYRLVFLKNLDCVENVDLPKSGSMYTRGLQLTPKRNFLMAAACLLLAVLMLANMIFNAGGLSEAFKFTDINRAVMTIASLGISYFCIYAAISLVRAGLTLMKK